MKKPGLKQLIAQVQSGHPTDREAFGRRSAIIFCQHGPNRVTVAEIRGNVLLGTASDHAQPHDLKHASYDVGVLCKRCQPVKLWQLDITKIRQALKQERTGPLKINVTEVCRSDE